MDLKKTLQSQSLYFSPSTFSGSSLISSKGPKKNGFKYHKELFITREQNRKFTPSSLCKFQGNPCQMML